MRAAPAIRAPWTTNCPTPPAPMTRTLEPGCTRFPLSAAPTPVSAAQPSSAACSSGTSAGMGSAVSAGTSTCSASAPTVVMR